MMKIVNVQIVKATVATCWYAGLVGRVFEVYKNHRDYILKEDYDRGHKAIWRHIAFDDCEEV